MIEVEITDKTIHIAKVTAWALAIVFLSWLGYRNSPRNVNGTPHILTPQIVSMMEYQKNAQRWIMQMEDAEKEVMTILNERDPFDQIKHENQIFNQVAALTQQIDQTSVPASMSRLRELLQESSLLYVQTTADLAQYLNEPTQVNLDQVMQSLQSAQAARENIQVPLFDAR